MKSITNDRRVRRNARVARVLTFGGIGTMLVGVLISLQQPYPVDLAFGLLFLGMIASQIGFPLRNRWDRQPRIDQILDEHLKGLDSRYVIFHYHLGASHALICPAGLFALLPRVEDGRIHRSEDQWKRTLKPRGIFRRGGTRLIRGLERDSAAEVERMQRRFRSYGGALEIQPLAVFIHAQASLDPALPPSHATHLKKLKSTLRKLPKANTLSDSQLQTLVSELAAV